MEPNITLWSFVLNPNTRKDEKLASNSRSRQFHIIQPELPIRIPCPGYILQVNTRILKLVIQISGQKDITKKQSAKLDYGNLH
jgi:hypothetical protein